MATHSSILAWETPMGRGAWQATVHGVSKESDTTEHAHHPIHVHCRSFKNISKHDKAFFFEHSSALMLPFRNYYH